MLEITAPGDKVVQWLGLNNENSRDWKGVVFQALGEEGISER